MLTGCKNEKKSNVTEIPTSAEERTEIKSEVNPQLDELEITPISHATGIFKWGKTIFYTDPVGGPEAFEGKPTPDFILVTDIHGDHMNAATLESLEPGQIKIFVPKAVQEKLPDDLQTNLIVINNGETKDYMGFKIKAIPMYNLPESKDAMHIKGRGNGYLIEKDGKKLYISGDTEDIPEMRNLQNIDIALVSMNLPYTMPVEQAADAVLTFKPKKVIPYHYRGKNGYSDIEKFKLLVNDGNKETEVELLDWYPSDKK